MVNGVYRSLLGFLSACSVAVLASVSSGSQAYNDDVTKWVALPESFGLYTTDTVERWYQAGLARIEWHVYPSGDGVRAALTTDVGGFEPPPAFSPRIKDYQFSTLDTYVRTDDGWLISFRRGEWGGALYWFSPDGTSNRFIGGLQVNQFLRESHRILAVEGLSHLGISNGSLIELSRSTDTKEWHYKTVKTLPETPYALVPLDDGVLLVVLFSSVVSLAPDGKISTIMTMNYGVGLGANSLVLTPDFLKAYLGRRNYVTELDFREKRVRYLVPEEMLRQLISPGTGETPQRAGRTPARIALPPPHPSLQ